MPRQLPLFGMALALLATVGLGTKDGLAKLIVEDYDPVFLAWLQYLATLAVAAPIVAARHGVSALRPAPFGLHALRGLLVMVTPLQFFISSRFIPLAESHALLFTGPLLAVVWSQLILREQVGRHRWSAVICGFIGIMLVLRPDFSNAQLGHLFAFGAGFTQSFYFILNRKVLAGGPVLAEVSHSVIFGVIVLVPLLFFTWPADLFARPGPLIWFAVASAFGQTLLILAFTFGQASFIAPFHYAIILTSIAFGLVVFDQFPDALTLSGIGIVVASGVYVAVREARKPAPCQAAHRDT